MATTHATAQRDPTPTLLNRELSWLDLNNRVLELAADPDRAAARARQVLRDLLLEPRRVLHGPRRRPARPGRARARRPLARRPHAAAGARRGPRARARADRRAVGALARRAACRRSPPRGSSSARSTTRRRASCTSSRRRFAREIYPVLTPLAVGPGQPFPYISGLSLSLGVDRARPGLRRGALRARQGAREPAALRLGRRPRAC